MPYTVALPDGRTVQFPDDVPPEKAAAILREQFPQPAVKPVTPSTERTFGEAIKDVPASLLSGAGSLLQFPGQIAKLVPGLKSVGEALEVPGEAVQKFGTDLKSAGLKAREALRSQAISDAAKDGLLSEFATAITSTLKDPALITSFVTEQVPLLLGPLGAARLTAKLGMGGVEAAGAAAAKGLTGEAAEAASRQAMDVAATQLGKRATTAAIGTGTAMQAGDVSGQTYTNTLSRALEMGMSQQEAEDAAINAARIAAAGGAAVSLGANLGLAKLGGTAIERRLAGLPGKGRIQSGVGEATSETLEEAGGQVFQNIGIRTIDPNQPLTEGVGTAAAMGALGGGFFGSMLGKKPQADLAPGQLPGESLYDTAARLNREIKSVEDLAKLGETDQGRTDAGLMTNTQLVDMYREQGYGAVKQYQQQLVDRANDPTTPPEQKTVARQAAQEIQDLFKQVSQEEVSRQIPSVQSYKITANDLTKFDIKGSDPVYKAAFGKDISDPVQVQEIQDSIDAELNRKGIRQTQAARLLFFKDALDRVVETLPAGGLYAPRTVEPSGGEGAGVAGVSGAGAAPAGARTVEPSGVVLTEPVATEPAVGKAKPTAPITEEAVTPQAVEETVTEEAPAVQEEQPAPAATTAKEAPAQPAVVEEKPAPVAKLPKDLSGAKPRYSYGDKQFQLTFDNDISKALYITAQTTPSKRDADYRTWLTGQGFTPEQITAGGKKVRDRIKSIAKDADPTAGPIGVPATSVPKKRSLRADQPLTEQDVEGLGVRRTAPAFKRIVGKTVEEAREELNKYRSLPDRYVPAETKRKIAQALGETVAEPEKPAAKAEEAKAPEAPKEKTQKEALLEQRAELIKQLDGILKKILAKYNLKGITLNLEEGMAEEGSYSGQIIRLALNLENPVRVLRHESIHALKDMGFFSDAQWKTLIKKAQDEWVQKYLKDREHTATQSRYDAYVELLTKEGLNPTEVQEAIIEEAIADAFGDFDVNGVPSGLISAIHRRMKNLFKAIKEAFGQAGIDTAEEIFGKIEKGSLKPAIPMGKEQAPKMSLRGVPLSTRSIMESSPLFAMNELGLKTEGVKKPGGIFLFNDVRSIANALNNDTINNYGVIDREDRSANARTLIAKAIADEVVYQVGTTSQTGTGLGWYSNNYPNAVRKLAKKYPELGTNEHARSVFSALVAITSNGEKVSLNIKNAIGLYDKLRSGEPLVAPDSRRATALDNNLQMVQDLIERHGTNFKNVLLQEILVKDMNAALRAKGKKPSADYLANTKVPAAAVYFGPKLGAFYANLEGAEGYLTMDMWWTRSINRMRGLLMPQATESSIKKFREEAVNPDMTRDEVIASTIPLRNRYEELDWTTDLEYIAGEKEPSTKEDKPRWTATAKRKAGPAYDQLKFEHDVMKMANTIYKNEYEMLEEAPFGPNDREFMYRAVREAQKLLKQDGIDLTLADIQAALWYYEKRLYQHLSGRKADDIGYDEAISAVAGESDRPARPSVVFDQQPDRGADSERGVEDIDGVRREPPEAGQVEKKSLRGVVAEVAPNPDIPVAASWRQMTQAERLDATRSVAKKVIDPILSDMGLKGYSFKFSSGKYEGEVNPNILIEAPESATVGELEEVARVVGYILDQKAMVAYDEYNTDSGDQAGFVKVMIPTGMDDKTVTLLRNHISKEVPQADGDTLRDGSLVYGNFSAYNDNVDTLSDEEYHDAIVRAIEDFDYSENIKVSDPLKFHSQLVWPDNRESYLEGTRYGESGKIRGGEGSDVWRQRRSRLEAISEQAIALRDRWIDARGAARIGGRAGDSAAISTEPTAEYGKSIDGSETAVGVHFSQQPRATLDSQFYGAGLRGMERERLEGQPDIRNRIYFYVDTGKGVFPEAGVGGSPHVIRLNNLYNVLKDELDLVKKAKGDTAAERANAWEKAIKNAGFDGYFFPDPLQRQGYAVLIGKHRIETKLSLRSQSPEFKFWFGQSKIVDKDGKPKVMYHGLAKDTTDFTRKTKRGAPIFLTDDPKFAGEFAKDSYESIARNPQEFLSKEQIDAGVKRAITAIRKDYGNDSFGQGMIDSLKTGSLKSAFPEALEYVQKELISLLPAGPHIMPLYVKADYPFDYENADHVKQVVNNLNQTTDSYGRMIGKKLAGDIAIGNWETIERGDVQDAIKELGFDSFYVKEDSKKNLAVYNPTQVKSATGNIGTYDVTNPDIRYSLRSTLPASAINAMDRIAPPRYNPGYAERIMNAITGDTFTSIRQKFINRYERLAEYDRRVAKQIKQMGGVQQLADSKAETAALFSDLGAGVLESVMGVHDRVGGAPIFRNGVTTVSNYGGTVKGLLEIFRPISAFKDPDVFRMYQTWSAVQRGMRLNVEGREELMTQADFKAINDLKRNNPSLIKTFEGVQKDWLAYNNALVKYQVDTGVITPAMAKEWTKHGDYFPFYRLIDGEDIAGPKTFSSIGNVTPSKKLKGGENALGDFFENIVRNSQAAIQAGMKNVAAQRATEQALRLNEVTRLTSKQTGVNVYRVYENGKEVYYKSHDPLFIEAIKSLNMADIPFMGLLAGPANLLRNLVTKDPAFMLANMMRDSLSAWATTGIKMTPVFDTLNNFSKAIAGKAPELDKLYAAGILGGYDYALGTKDAARAFETQLRRRSGQLTAFEIGTKPVTSLWGALEKGTQASDAATRMEVYKKTLAATGNEAEALAAALEVMNFNRKGNNPMIRVLTAAVPFLNARIQGLDVLFRTAFMPLGGSSNEQAQQRMKTFWVRGMTMLALSSMYWLLTHDDEEYKKQEQETRDNNWLIPSLGIKIPIPFEVGVMFKVIPERIMALSFGADTAKDFTDSMKRQFVGTFAFNPIPQVVLPLYEAKTNYSFFTDRPIIGKGLENVADKYQIGPSTSRTAQIIGDSLGFSPMKVDHLIKGYTGTIGTYASDLFDMVYDMGADSPKASKRFEQMPIIKRFAVDPEARGTVTAYYKLKDQVDQAVRTANLLERSNNFEEGTKYTLDNLRLLATDDYVKDIEKSMKDYREMKQQIMAAPYSADTKRDLLKSIGQMESLTTANIQNIKKFAQ